MKWYSYSVGEAYWERPQLGPGIYNGLNWHLPHLCSMAGPNDSENGEQVRFFNGMGTPTY